MDNLFTIADAVRDNFDELLAHPPEIRTWIFDPPYNIGFNYGGVVDDDSDSYEVDIWQMCLTMSLYSRLDSNLFLIIYPEIAARLLPWVEKAGWNFKQWITWVYPSNMGHSKKKFTRGSRAVVWFTKNNPIFNHKAVVQPYKEDSKKTRAMIAKGSLGAGLYDWWEINLRKNVSKGYAGYFNQLPPKLVENIILHTTKEGEWVGDLTAGAGTAWEVSKKHNRSCWLNDVNPDCMDIWRNI